MFNQNPYSSNSPYGASSSSEPLAFYSGPSSSNSGAGGYYSQAGGPSNSAGGGSGSGSGGYGASGSMGSMGTMSGAGRVGSMLAGEGRWWEAFGTGGFEGEPSLMEGEWLCVYVAVATV